MFNRSSVWLLRDISTALVVKKKKYNIVSADLNLCSTSSLVQDQFWYFWLPASVHRHTVNFINTLALSHVKGFINSMCCCIYTWNGQSFSRIYNQFVVDFSDIDYERAFNTDSFLCFPSEMLFYFLFKIQYLRLTILVYMLSSLLWFCLPSQILYLGNTSPDSWK